MTLGCTKTSEKRSRNVLTSDVVGDKLDFPPYSLRLFMKNGIL